MLRACRSAILAIGLILCTSLAPSQDQPGRDLEREPVADHGEQESAAEKQQPIDYSPIFKRIEGAIRDLVSEENEQARRRQEQRETSVLEAQQDMAFWTESMFWASVAAVAVTFVGVALVGWTLYHTRRAADYARDMVKEAEKTTDAALKTVQAERAWVSFNGIQTFTDGDNIGFAVEWTNSGRSPALDVQTYVTYDILNRGDEEIIQFDKPKPKIIHKSTPFGPQMTKMTNVFMLRSGEFDLWASGAIRLIIYSFVWYRDFYSETPRHTEFCGDIEYTGETVASDGRLHIKTYTHPYGQQNTGS